MDRARVCEHLCKLNENISIESASLMQVLLNNCHKIKEENEISFNDLDLGKLNIDSDVDTYLILNFHFLNELKSSLMASDDALNVLSLQQNKMIRDALHQLIIIGIRFNLQPKLPQYIKPNQSYASEAKTLTSYYNRLCYTTRFLISLLQCDGLRPLIVVVGFDAILNAIYQIIYCPLKKPGDSSGGNLITQELYDGFKQDQCEFCQLLDHCQEIMPKEIFIKETMLLLRSECRWFTAAVNKNLNKMLTAENGLMLITNVLMEPSRDYESNDSTKNWKTIDVLTKLIIGMRTRYGINESVKQQLLKLVLEGDGSKGPFEMIFVSCVKNFYLVDKELCRIDLLAPVFGLILLQLINVDEIAMAVIPFEEHYFLNKKEDVTDAIQRTMRLLRLLFVETTVGAPDLPNCELSICIDAIFRIYTATTHGRSFNATIEAIVQDMETILINYLWKASRGIGYNDATILKKINKHIFDTCLCGSRVTFFYRGVDTRLRPHAIFLFNEFLSVILADNKFFVSLCPQDIALSNDETLRAQALYKLLKKPDTRISDKFKMSFFLRLLTLFNNPPGTSRKGQSVTEAERKFTDMSKKLRLYNLLTALVEDKNVQKMLSDDSSDFFDFVGDALTKAIQRGEYRKDNCESSDFRIIFLLITILQALVTTTCKKKWTKVAVVLNPLQTIRDRCVNDELRALATSVIDALEGRGSGITGSAQEDDGEAKCKSELDKAIDDVCDPLLPVRAAGLVTLAKLVENKHPDVLGRKMFILNIFHQNIKHEDSYIYLQAIKGLVTMTDLFPDTVLEILVDEYSGLDQSMGGPATSLETRMKLGEVLMKVSRNLGDRALQYKSLLLNTFLLTAKDDDHLMRASSLSNLGELCQVLGNKLGTIVNEVLHLVRDVIMTDPAVEARRAAVTVFRGLFIGLGPKTFPFFHGQIEDVYRSLREIYDKDDDAVMRLQAQLAIEELQAGNMERFNQLQL